MSNFENYLSLVDNIANRLKREHDVEGILLFGSVAEGKVAKRSDIDIMVMVENEKSYYKDCRFIEGIWVEQYFKTYEQLKSIIERKALVHVHMFKDGKILYDPKDKMSKLKQIASRIVEEYKPTAKELKNKRLQIQFFIDDLLDMKEDEGLESTLFYMCDNQYIVFDTLFKINNHFTPKFKDTYHKFDELKTKPKEFNRLLKEILLSPKSEKRLESFLELANWTLDNLGGRLDKIKE